MLAAASSVHTIRWANAFVQRGMEVHLVSLHTPHSLLDHRVTVHRFPYLKGLGYVVNGPLLARLVRTLKPDVVNAHYATGYGTLARWCAPAPLVLNVWGSDVFEFPEKSPLHKRSLLGNLTRATHIVSTSEAMAARVRSLLPVPKPLTVVPFGVDTDLFTPRPPGDNVPKGVTFGTVKALERVYGIDLLIEAFALLVAKRPALELRLRIVGGGGQRDALQRLAASSGVADKITFVGAVPHDRVPGELRKFDVFVALSRAESFGVAVVEAGACGLPVVVSNVGGLPEVVRNGTTGLVVPASDAFEASVQMGRLCDSPELRTSLGRNGREMVCSEFAWSVCVDRMLDVLQNNVRQNMNR